MPNIQDAWCYPPSVSRRGENVCFRPDKAAKLLKVKAVVLGTGARAEDGYIDYSFHGVVTNFEENFSEYYPANTKEFIEIFKEIDPLKGRLNDFN